MLIVEADIPSGNKSKFNIVCRHIENIAGRNNNICILPYFKRTCFIINTKDFCSIKSYSLQRFFFCKSISTVCPAAKGRLP